MPSGLVLHIFASSPERGLQNSAACRGRPGEAHGGGAGEAQGVGALEGSSQCVHQASWEQEARAFARAAGNPGCCVKFSNIKMLATNLYLDNTTTRDNSARDPKGITKSRAWPAGCQSGPPPGLSVLLLSDVPASGFLCP